MAAYYPKLTASWPLVYLFGLACDGGYVSRRDCAGTIPYLMVEAVEVTLTVMQCTLMVCSDSPPVAWHIFDGFSEYSMRYFFETLDCIPSASYAEDRAVVQRFSGDKIHHRTTRLLCHSPRTLLA